MAYRLAKQNGDSVAVPQIVFSNLGKAEDNWLRVALYILATGECDAARIMHALRISPAESVRSALVFWKGVGLLEDAHEADVPLAAQPQPCVPRTRVTTADMARAANGDKKIAQLVQECQMIFGGIINEADTAIFVSLYLQDQLPPEMILLATAYFAEQGKRSARYIERVLLGWKEDGIASYDALEKHLHLLAARKERYARVAQLLSQPEIKFTKSDEAKINEWYEGFGFDDGMVAEAAAHAGDGEKRCVKYINGILRTWYSKGLRTVKDVMRESAGTMQNTVVTNAAASKKQVLTGGYRPLPKLPIQK